MKTEMHGYDIYYKVGTHKTLITFSRNVYDHQIKAMEAAYDAITWYLERAFVGADYNDFLIDFKKLYA